MGKISAVTPITLMPVVDRVKEKTKGCKLLEEAAQGVTNILYEEFGNSIALVRVFATIPFEKLPASNRAFVTQLATKQNILPLIKSNTLVLSLLGTRGNNPLWNDRRQSQGHVGIPLASATFVGKIPMMSRLLKEVGLNLDWIDNQDTDIVTRTIGNISGVFYVQDAQQATDHLGRKIIAAQDFVKDNAIKTVFGLAGGYTTNRIFVTLIVFCRESLTKAQAESFSPIMGIFKANTTPLASAGAILT